MFEMLQLPCHARFPEKSCPDPQEEHLMRPIAVEKRLTCSVLGLARPKMNTHLDRKAHRQACWRRAQARSILIELVAADRLDIQAYLGGSPP